MNRPNSWQRAALLFLSTFSGVEGVWAQGTSTATTPPSPIEQAGSTWTFDYPKDFITKTLFDLRSLNEPVAGSKGFIRRTADGSDFAFPNGQRLRFFAVNVGKVNDLPTHARFLAKQGVNLGRILSTISPKGKESKITDVDEQEIDRIWRTVAALKKEGIYSDIQPWWAYPDQVQIVPESWGLEGYSGTGNTSLFGVMFFDEKLEDAYKAWMKALYTRVNPHTGLRLADDPAVAYIETTHEDSTLFWTVDALSAPTKLKARSKFGAWLKAKYGSLDATKTAWGSAVVPEDDFANNLPQLLGMWELTTPQSGEKATRVRDQVQFLAENQRGLYTRIERYLRGLGCKQLRTGSNWRTVDPVRLNDIERWTYGSNQVMTLNNYYNGGTHNGPNASWRIDPGDLFTNESVLFNPRNFPGVIKQVQGYPFVITETGWLSPLSYQTEATFLAMAYQSLTGLDGFCWFNTGAPTYDPNPYFPWQQVEGQNPLMSIWNISIPTIQGGFPAAALAYRKGYIKQGVPVVHEERHLEDMWERQLPVIAEQGSYDPFRDASNTTRDTKPTTVADPLAFLVGPVEAKYGGDPAKTRVANLSKAIDRNRKIIRSNTGEIVWNYGTGLCTVNAPMVQGATGFLQKAGTIKLSAVQINSSNQYATVTLVSLDGKPLKSSGKIFVQVGTEAFPTGWKTESATIKDDKGNAQPGLKVLSVGKMPWQIVDTKVQLRLTNPTLRKLVLLDPAGRAQSTLALKPQKGVVSANLPRTTMYAILQAKN